MQACRLTIITKADEQETTFTHEGEMELSPTAVTLRYREENAEVFLRLQGETAMIERRGDYSLRLALVRGEMQPGEIGIGGSSGEILAYTHKIAYSVTKDSLLLSLRYDLIMGGEPQKMQLRLLSRFKKEETL